MTSGHFTIVKHIIFQEKTKVSFIKGLAHGQLQRMEFSHPKMGTKVWQYVLENLGGMQFTTFHLTPESLSKGKSVLDMNALTDDDVDAGFEYITENAPRAATGMSQLVWVTKALKNDTPIKGWNCGLVKEAIRNLTMEGALAREESKWYITLMDYVPWLREILEEVLDSMHAVTLLGEPNAGKSPLGRSIVMALCRYNKHRFGKEGDVCFRASSEFDFF